MDFSAAQRVFNASPNHQVLNNGGLVASLNVGSVESAEVITSRGKLLFAGAPIAGKVQVLEAGTLSVRVETSNQFGNFAAAYDNNDGLQQLLSSVAVSERIGAGEGFIDVSLEGLTLGKKYRLQLFHVQAGVDPLVREMAILNRDDPDEYSGLFTPATEQSAVRTLVQWTAEVPTLNLRILANPRGSPYNRAVLNGLALHAL